MSRSNRIISDALAGVPVETSLAGLYGSCIAGIEAALAEFNAEDQRVSRLGSSLDPKVFAGASEHPEFDEALCDARHRFTELALAVRRAFLEKESFRVQMGLCREPDTPDTTESLLAAGFAILVDATLTAMFFAQSGLSANAATAIGASSVLAIGVGSWCVGSGYFLGRGWRYGIDSGERDEPEVRNRRRISRIGSCIAGGIAAFSQFAIASVREQGTFGISFGLAETIDVLTSPVSLSLLMLGSVLCAINWMMGVSGFSDSHLDYGRKGRSLDDACDGLDRAYERSCESLGKLRQDKLESLADDRDSLTHKIAEYNEAVVSRDHKLRNVWQAVQRAKDLFLEEAPRLVATHNSARTADEQQSPALDTLSDFTAYLPDNSDPPQKMEVPDFSSLEAAVCSAHARASRELTEIFDGAMALSKGESNGNT